VVEHLPYVLRDLDDTTPSTSTVNSSESEEGDLTIAGHHDAQRMRSFLKRTVLLSRQAQEEIVKRTEYLRLLKYHYEGVANLRKLMRGVELDYWFWMCERWRELARKYHEPLSESKCNAIMLETLEAIKNYTLPEGMKQNDVFGWCDSAHLDDDHRYVRIMTRKTLYTDMKQLVDHAWSLYSDGGAFKKGHLGDNCDFFHQVLQEISPDTYIIQRVERYPGLAQMTHTLAIAFRVQTATGYMIVYRCIESPRLQSLMKADGLSLCGTFAWEAYDVAHTNEEGECDAIHFTAAGSVGSDDPTYAKRWRDELAIALMRYETQFIEPIFSTEDDGIVTSGPLVMTPSSSVDNLAAEAT
jgi:hypothetical protein